MTGEARMTNGNSKKTYSSSENHKKTREAGSKARDDMPIVEIQERSQ
jgi:hypothetical protein